MVLKCKLCSRENSIGKFYLVYIAKILFCSVVRVTPKTLHKLRVFGDTAKSISILFHLALLPPLMLI